MLYLTIFIVMYLAIFFKALQQLNTTFKNYILYIPTSIVLFSMEMLGISTVVWVAFPHELIKDTIAAMVSTGFTFQHVMVILKNMDWFLLFIGGFGAGCGGMTGMYVHRTFIPVGKQYKNH